MSWWGKILGGGFGFLMGGPLGAVMGAAFGHQFDKGVNQDFDGRGYQAQERTQLAFFSAVFSVMGHVAKADGRVTPDEIEMARALMQQMSLDEQQQQLAIGLFNQGKQSDFDLDGVLNQFKQECRRHTTLVQMFIEVLLHAAHADGVMHPNEREVLKHITITLGFSSIKFQQLDDRVRSQRSFHQGGGYAGSTQVPTRDRLNDAYAMLNSSESSTDAEVKKAYRRLMNQHHPDKLVAKGMPEEMIKMTTEKTQEIKAAYELIKKSRK
ncbi:co-chaperone DjlA [Beggiatoa alba]|nr:co-chaperone DjlA [Beggiatoa alba]